MKFEEPSPEDSSLDRRKFLTTSTAVLLATFAGEASGQQLDDTRKARHDQSATDPGPENKLLNQANPQTFNPPVTDHGEVESFWNSFTTSHRRIQEGGWSRQVTVADFPLSKDIAGVNMRLTAGGIRELHWHNAGEWSIMLSGSARITIIDNDGKSQVRDVVKNDLWFFPAGNPHSIQGLGPEGCEFLLVFDDGKFSEANTTLISDWARHTPVEVLAHNWGVSEEDVQPVYQQPTEGHYIFQAPVPPALEQDVNAASAHAGRSPLSFTFPMSTMTPTHQTAGGEVRIIDTRNFPVSTTIAAAHVVLKPGAIRELHWHQNADEWQYYIQGQGRMTVFFNGAKARTADFNAGDVGVVPRTYGHYIENTGTVDLIFLEMFKSPRYQDLSLNEWIANTPPELIKQHLGISSETLAAIPKKKQIIIPKR